MPELPEVELARGLVHGAAWKKQITRVWMGSIGRPIVPVGAADHWVGKRVETVARHGKGLMIDLNGGGCICAQQGMSGRFVVRDPGHRHDRIALQLDDDGWVVFNDFRRFGRWTWFPNGSARWLEGLGPDACSAAFSAEVVARSTRRPIKSLLMDQSVVAGIGNIYANEALFTAGIHPSRQTRSLTDDERIRLVEAVKAILTAAIACGGSTLEDYRGTEGASGDYERFFSVYGREGQPCDDCDCGCCIAKITIEGRATFVCEHRQR